MKYYNLFKTSRTTHKNPLTPAIQTNENKKRDIKQGGFDNLVHSTDPANIVTVKYGSSRVGNEIPKEV